MDVGGLNTAEWGKGVGVSTCLVMFIGRRKVATKGYRLWLGDTVMGEIGIKGWCSSVGDKIPSAGGIAVIGFGVTGFADGLCCTDLRVGLGVATWRSSWLKIVGFKFELSDCVCGEVGVLWAGCPLVSRATPNLVVCSWG